MRWLVMTVLLSMFAPAFGQSQTHALGLRLKVGDELLAAPVVELRSDTPATLTLTGAPDSPGYILLLRVSDAEAPAVRLDASVYRGTDTSKPPLASPTLVFEEGGTPSATLQRDGEPMITIEVTSHARRTNAGTQSESP